MQSCLIIIINWVTDCSVRRGLPWCHHGHLTEIKILLQFGSWCFEIQLIIQMCHASCVNKITNPSCSPHFGCKNITMQRVESARWGHHSHHNPGGPDLNVTWSDLPPAWLLEAVPTWFSITTKKPGTYFLMEGAWFPWDWLIDWLIDLAKIFNYKHNNVHVGPGYYFHEVIVCVFENNFLCLFIDYSDSIEYNCKIAERLSIFIFETPGSIPDSKDHFLRITDW